ncbi:ATP-binding protein [Flavihumibacter sp. CACIAM 22H1]|uniref:HAMP domain-containing sensor histidine kinase n=1 Tax=Flavihumibacter sp. CACIAM 22H1 TaxID=1812911 RepID=UPI0025BFF314|nr:ATP-binding protein [Flavihumibacter sp. CACIAM 22H1]
MSVKNKIRWGTVFLFLLVITSGAVGIYYLVKLRLQTSNMLTANYESLEYAHRMQAAFDRVAQGEHRFTDTLEHYLILQESNITEKGEATATSHLRKALEEFKQGDSLQGTRLRQHLQSILLLNMKGIRAKSENAEAASEQAVKIIIASVAVILLIGFTFVVNFPSILTNPINKLTEAIKEISQKNYRHRIHIQTKDEFGQLAHSFNEMAARLEYFENSNLAKLIFEKTRAEAVINSLKDASIGIDKNDTVLFANEQALQLLGLAAKDIVGEKAEQVAKRNDLFRFLAEESSTNPFKVVVDNRENYFIKEVIGMGQDTSAGKVFVLKNITSFKELDVAKTNFIATISHELKTPLASADFSIKLLLDERVGKLTEEQKELVNSLHADNQRMLRILSELLNLSQVEAGKIQLNRQAVNIYQVIENSIHAVAVPAKEKSIRMVQHIDEGLPELMGDPDKIGWVLNNFLTNAIKYGPVNSEILISVRFAESELRISVKDQGQGIEEAYLTRIFERYYQVPGRSDKMGSGIGLAICKEIVEAMGGTIWVSSRIGEGSVFGFTLKASF